MNNLIQKTKDWEIKKLGELCTIKTGKRDANHGNPNGKYHFFTCAKDHSYIDDYSFDTEAILVAGNGDVGAVKYFKGKFDAYQRTYVLHDFSPQINIDLLYKFLDGPLKDTVSKQKLGGTMPYIKLGMLRDFEISFPKSLDEQKRIVGILDEAFENIDQTKTIAEQNLKNIQELFESELQNIFSNNSDGWETKSFECCINKIVYPKKILKRNFLEEGEYPVISQESDYINGYYSSEENLFKINNPIVIFGDHTKVLKYIDFDFILGADGVKILDPKGFLGSRYFFYLLKSIHLKDLGYARHYKLLKELEISFPKSLEEQQKIVERLDGLKEKVDDGAAILCSKIAALDELKKSLLQKAFNGEL